MGLLAEICKRVQDDDLSQYDHRNAYPDYAWNSWLL